MCVCIDGKWEAFEATFVTCTCAYTHTHTHTRIRNFSQLPSIFTSSNRSCVHKLSMPWRDRKFVFLKRSDRALNPEYFILTLNGWSIAELLFLGTSSWYFFLRLKPINHLNCCSPSLWQGFLARRITDVPWKLPGEAYFSVRPLYCYNFKRVSHTT